MKKALSSVMHKYPPARAPFEATSTDPLLGLARAASAAARSAIPRNRLAYGLGFDALDLVELGVTAVTNPQALYLELGRDLLGEFLGSALPRWAVAMMDWIGPVWKVLESFPFIGKYMKLLAHLGSNLLDTLLLELFGLRQDPSDPPRGEIDSLCEVPVYPDPDSDNQKLDYQKFKALNNGTEIAFQIKTILDELLPKIYTFHDDTPPVVWEHLQYYINNLSTLPNLSPPAFDIDDEYADDPSRVASGNPYVNAWKLSDRRIIARIGMMRCGSYWPCSKATEGLLFEHEGDGESLFAHLQVDPLDDDGFLNDDAKTALVRLTAIIGSFHGEKAYYGWDKLRIDKDGRAWASVARGSHAATILEGQAASGGGIFWAQTDTYPGPSTSVDVDIYKTWRISGEPGAAAGESPTQTAEEIKYMFYSGTLTDLRIEDKDGKQQLYWGYRRATSLGNQVSLGYPVWNDAHGWGPPAESATGEEREKQQKAWNKLIGIALLESSEGSGGAPACDQSNANCKNKLCPRRSASVKAPTDAPTVGAIEASSLAFPTQGSLYHRRIVGGLGSIPDNGKDCILVSADGEEALNEDLKLNALLYDGKDDTPASSTGT